MNGRGADAAANGVILLGGAEKSGLRECRADGRYPRAEYAEMLRKHGFDLLTFSDVSSSPERIVGAIRSRAGMYWAMGALARLQQARWQQVFTTGEDVGLPLALIQRVTRGRTPVAILFHGSYLGSPKAALVFRLVRGMRNMVFLCLSETLRGQLISRYGIPEERVAWVGYGVDTDFFHPVEASSPGLIMAAGMARRDYRTLAAAVSGRDVRVRIAADSAWFRTRTDIEGQALPPNVEAGSCGDYMGLRELYGDSAFVVVPLYESVHACGYAVIAEAMAMGKPVITTRITGHGDYIVEGETGFYVPPGDPAALGERIQYLLDRPELAREMGRKARRLIEERFSLDAYVGRIAAAMGLSV